MRACTTYRQESGKCDETEVLLGADVEHQPPDADCEDLYARGEATHPADLRLSLQALGNGMPDCNGVLLPGPPQLQGASDAAESFGVLITPDDVKILLHDDAATEMHATAAPPSNACMLAANERAANERASVLYTAPEPASHGSMARSEASIFHSTASCSTAVDSDSKTFLQGLLDTGFGPPKFTIPKAQLDAPAATLQSPEHAGHMSLEQLLSTSLGPPKFVVPNPDPSPMLAQVPAPPTSRASDTTTLQNMACAPVLDFSSPTVGDSRSSNFVEKVIYNTPAAPHSLLHPQIETQQSSQEQQQAQEQQQHYAQQLEVESISSPSAATERSAASLEPMPLAASSRPMASGGSSHSSHTIASSASSAVYQQLNSKIPRASSKRASLLPVVVELGTPYLRMELISGPDTGKVHTLTDADINVSACF